ncbi:SAF domain-containing protein [Streptomyces xiamenensis]|uniref:SAF domain-containing protein n=1 Tax=Streptomyces xiamenensis TaxID=408015 RepID=UPI0035E20A7A
MSDRMMMATTLPHAQAPASGPGEVPISEARASSGNRNRPVVVAGLLLVLISALAGGWLVSSAGDRVDVLAVARDVPIGTELTAADVQVVALPETPGLSPVPAADLDAVVGQVTTVTLTAGTVLTRQQLAQQSLLGDGESLVALALARGMGPVSVLDIGDTVEAVPVPKQGAEDLETQTFSGRVVEIGRANANGEVVVLLAVAESDSAQLARTAGAGQVSLVLTGKG